MAAPPIKRDPWRYALILVLVGTAVVVAAAAGWRFARTSSAPSAGPIILISIDSVRADHLPPYGGTTLRTPAINELAADGVVFDHAYTHSPQTLPAHVAILSGRLPFETGVRDDEGTTLPASVTLLPQMLKKRGYASAGVVSSGILGQQTGLARRFDFYDGPVEGATRNGEESVAVAKKWIATVRSPRFLLFMHLAEPHAPYEPPRRYSAYPPYDGEIVAADEHIGALTKWLKERGLYDRATIIVLSDHGEGLGDHVEREHGVTLYDEAVRVPLVVKLPRDMNHGRRVPVPVQMVDVVPTILDLLDLPRDPALGGASVKLLAEGQAVKLDREPVFYAESLYGRNRLGWAPQVSLRAGARYTLISGVTEELYDVQQDPGERSNVLLRDPGTRTDAERNALAVADTLRAELKRLNAVGATPAVAGQPTDPADVTRVLDAHREAMSLRAARRFADAARVLRAIVEEHPDIARAWADLGDVLVCGGRGTDALDAYTRATKLAPTDGRAQLAFAQALWKARKPAEAIAHARQAAVALPAPSHELLARIALDQNNLPVARREAEAAHAADPGLPMPDFVEGVALYTAGKYEQALPVLQQAAEAVAPRDPVSIGGPVPLLDLHYYLADTFNRLDRFAEAEEHLAVELRYHPHNTRARVSLAMLYFVQHRAEDATKAIADMLGPEATAEDYAAAARLSTIMGDRDRGAAIVAESRQRFR